MVRRPSAIFSLLLSILVRFPMMYFIPWVVFLLVVILAVPVTAMLEKRKLRPLDDGDVEEFDQDDVENDDGGEVEAFDEFSEVEPAEGEEFPVAGGEDFSAFDEEFK